MVGMRLQRHLHTRENLSTYHHVHIEVDNAGVWEKTDYGVDCGTAATNAAIEARATSLLVGTEDYVAADLTPITWLANS